MLKAGGVLTPERRAMAKDGTACGRRARGRRIGGFSRRNYFVCWPVPWGGDLG